MTVLGFDPEAAACRGRPATGKRRAASGASAGITSVCSFGFRSGAELTKVDVEDLLQEISLEIHRKITLFRGGSDGEFLTWTRRLIGSILANQVRHDLGTQGPRRPSGASADRRPGSFVVRPE